MILAFRLFASLVDLVEELLKYSLLETLALVNVVDELLDLIAALLLELLIALLQLQVVVELLDDCLLLVVLLAVVLLEDLALLRSGDGQGLVNQPRALVVLDVGTNLADVLGQTEVVEVVVLDLKVLAQGDQNILGLLEVLGSGEVKLVESQGDREVKGVVGGLVDDDELVLVHGEVIKVDLILRGGEQVAKLAELSLEGGLVEQLDEVDVGGMGLAVLLEEGVNSHLEHKGIVDGDHANALLAVPAGLTSTGDAAVHDVVGDEEECLQKLRHPAEGSGLEVLLLGEGLFEEERDGVGNGHAAVAFTAEGIDIETLELDIRY